MAGTSGTAGASGQPLLREFIHIPERTSTSDFVLKLTEGVADTDTTLRDYVITDRLVENFDQALGLIASAVGGGGSKAAYLHGSFGSGKSHFMAVLHALLRGDPRARSRDEFAGLLARHDGWLAGRRFLLVPYYLLGAKSLEQRVLGGYARYVRTLHPGAPVPAVHRTDALLSNAALVRKEVGDEAFAARLVGGGGGTGTGGTAGSAVGGASGSGADAACAGDEWGDDERFWTTARLDAAFAAGHDDTVRRRLVSDLLIGWFPGFFQNAQEDAEGFVSLDRGLTEISRHAKDLGYDGLVLFLDELILWLASLIGNQELVAREAHKITNFVESGDARRPIPIISFIARQRDLRELVGEQVTGAEQLSFQDTLNLASGRFDVITLEDRNLPEIVHRRLLAPVSAEARAAIDSAFERTRGLRRDVWDTVLGAGGTTTGADTDAFRRSYPFTPAFLDTLVHVSSALQRSRTGLKLMRQLLVDHRDDLRLGQLVPLGDLYDVISRGGDQPFTEKLKVEFEAAQKLYTTKLRPYLLEAHRLGEDNLERHPAAGTAAYPVAAHPAADPGLAARLRAFAGDDRLLKTLLLSALAPTVPALRNLTVRKLTALNHGSITSPIPGQENSQVARKVQTWAARFGEIKVTEADDPGVSLELVGVDVASILTSAGHYDTVGARRTLLQRLLWDELGVTSTGEFVDRADLVWRGSRRSVEMVFGNVRNRDELRDDAFRSFDDTVWRVVVDYPFDEGTHTPVDDLRRVEELRARLGPVRTVCWLPAAFTVERLADLRQLVVVDAVLSGQRFDEYSQDLGPTDRHRARATLESQRAALLTKIRTVLRQAYGLAQKQHEDVNVGFDEHLAPLTTGLGLTLPAGAPMREALRSVTHQMLAHQYPAHPDFDPERTGALVRVADAKIVLQCVRNAVESRDGFVEVDKAHRPILRRIADPLLLGEMHEAKFVLGRHWVTHFHQLAAQEGKAGAAAGDTGVTSSTGSTSNTGSTGVTGDTGDTGDTGELKVADLLRWLDRPRDRGLDRLVAHLVVLCFAEQTDRLWVRHGGVLTSPPELTAVTDDLALREQRLPNAQAWEAARVRAQKVFGLEPPALRRGRLVTTFAVRLRAQARERLADAHALVRALETHAEALGIDRQAPGGRLATARAAVRLLDGLAARDNPVDAVEFLAVADLGGPPERLARSISTAAGVTRALDAAPWRIFAMVADLPEPHRGAATALLGTLAEAACADESTLTLPAALTRAEHAAHDLLRNAVPARTAPLPPTPPTPRPEPTPPGPTPPPPVRGGPRPSEVRPPEVRPPQERPPDAHRPEVRQPDIRRPGVDVDQIGPVPPASATPGGDRPTTRTTDAANIDELLTELRAAVDSHPESRFEVTWRRLG